MKIYQPTTGGGGGGGVSSVSGTSPIASSGGTTPVISISLPANEVAFGTGTNVSSSSNLIFTASTDVLKLTQPIGGIMMHHLTNVNGTVYDKFENTSAGSFASTGLRWYNDAGLKAQMLQLSSTNGLGNNKFVWDGVAAGITITSRTGKVDLATVDVNDSNAWFRLFNNGHIAIGANPSDAGYNFDVQVDAHLGAKLFDSTGSAGTSGQILSSTGTATQWIAAPSGGGMVIGDPVTSGTAPAVLFVGPGNVLAQDPANFYYDTDPTIGSFMTRVISGTPLIDLIVGTGLGQSSDFHMAASQGYWSIANVTNQNADFQFVETGGVFNIHMATLDPVAGLGALVEAIPSAITSKVDDSTGANTFVAKSEVNDTFVGSSYQDITNSIISSNYFSPAFALVSFADINTNVTSQLTAAESSIASVWTNSINVSTLSAGSTGTKLQFESPGSYTAKVDASGSGSLDLIFSDLAGGTLSRTDYNGGGIASRTSDGGTTYDVRSLVNSTNIDLIFTDVANSRASELNLASIGLTLNWTDTFSSLQGGFSVQSGATVINYVDSSIGTIASQITLDPTQATTEFTDGTNYDSINTLSATQNISEFTTGTGVDAYVKLNATQTQLQYSDATVQPLVTLDATRLTTSFADIAGNYLSRNELTSSSNIGLLTDYINFTATSQMNTGGSLYKFEDIIGQQNSNLSLLGNTLSLQYENTAASRITGIIATDQVTTLGTTTGGNGTKITIDDTVQTYTLSKLAGTGTRVVTADSTGILGTSNGQLPHAIFTPTTGGTVNLTNNTYNAINPAGAILALTLQFPTSPANNDVIDIKFDFGVTTVTYTPGAGDTIVGGFISPVAGQYVRFVYDLATTTWY